MRAHSGLSLLRRRWCRSMRTTRGAVLLIDWWMKRNMTLQLLQSLRTSALSTAGGFTRTTALRNSCFACSLTGTDLSKSCSNVMALAVIKVTQNITRMQNCASCCYWSVCSRGATWNGEWLLESYCEDFCCRGKHQCAVCLQSFIESIAMIYLQRVA